ncbi:MAG: hypothetical protein MJK04_01895, partial [Psychrosphaera sp.]|nr:hypothetical protein [Psychrosphaera sp.]
MNYTRLFLILCAFAFAAPIVHAQDNPPNAVKGVKFDADYFPGNSKAGKGKGKYGVIIMGGSGGGKWTNMAKRIAHLGHPVLSLAYFNKRTPNELVPASLEMIPLEYFAAPKKWLMDRQETRNDGVILIGLSKGAELALVLSAYDSDYSGVIAIAPSSVVWAGIPKKMSTIMSAPSSWSVNGTGLDFVPYVSMSGLIKAGIDAATTNRHIASIANMTDLDKALIKVEKIKSPMLLLSGGRDIMWPANGMAANVCKRANADKKKVLCRHINY